MNYYVRSLTFIYSWACSFSDDSADDLTNDDLENVGFGDNGSGKGLELWFVFWTLIYSLLTLDDFGKVAVVFLGARDGTVFDDLDGGVIPKSFWLLRK